MRNITVGIVALLLCAAVAPSAMALGTPSADQGGFSSEAALADGMGMAQQGGAANGNTTNQSNESLGVRMSSFVQSTSSETNGVVQSEMWAAGATRAGRPEAVDQQITRIRGQLSTLQSERSDLREAYEAGEMSRLEYQSKMARLNGRLVALATAAETTGRAAERLNTEPKGLDTVREDIQKDMREARARGGPGLGAMPQGLGPKAETDGSSGKAGGNDATSDTGGVTDNEEDTGNTTTTETVATVDVSWP